MSDKRKRITDFVAKADERALNRLLIVIEAVESPVLGFTETGEPVLMEDLLNVVNAQKGVLPQEEFDRRMTVLNRLKESHFTAKLSEL